MATAVEKIMGGYIVLVLATFGGIAYGAVRGVQALNKYLNRPEVVRSNVIGGPKEETYMDRDGKRFFAEVDGKSIESILSDNSTK